MFVSFGPSRAAPKTGDMGSFVAVEMAPTEAFSLRQGQNAQKNKHQQISELLHVNSYVHGISS